MDGRMDGLTDQWMETDRDGQRQTEMDREGTKQLICQLNMLLQHYHTSTALSKKLDASFKYLQLQLGTPYNPLTLPFNQWGYLAPLSWVKMLWHSLDTFNIQLHMKYPPLLFPRE